MWDAGMKMPTQMPDLRSRCFCGAEIVTATTALIDALMHALKNTLGNYLT